MTSYPLILLFSILLCTVTTALAIMLKRSNITKDKLLAQMQAPLSSQQDIGQEHHKPGGTAQDEALFEASLRSAGLTTRFQQPRLLVQQQIHCSAAPERYRYIQSMVEMNLSAPEIAATLSMSLQETTQIITLIKMANPRLQDDTSVLPSPEAKEPRSHQHGWTKRPTATNHENHSVPELENDLHINHHHTKEDPVKKCAPYQPLASEPSGVARKSRKLARWLRIRAFPPCLRSQGGREPPQQPPPHAPNLAPAPLSGYT